MKATPLEEFAAGRISSQWAQLQMQQTAAFAVSMSPAVSAGGSFGAEAESPPALACSPEKKKNFTRLRERCSAPPLWPAKQLTVQLHNWRPDNASLVSTRAA